MPRLTDAARIERMLNLREEIRAEEAITKVKKAKLKEMEDTAISNLLKKNMISQKTKAGTASVSTEEVAQVNDWEDAFEYIRKKNAFYLMFKRINNAAWREEVAANKNKPIPGISGFTKYKLSLRKGDL